MTLLPFSGGIIAATRSGAPTRYEWKHAGEEVEAAEGRPTKEQPVPSPDDVAQPAGPRRPSDRTMPRARPSERHLRYVRDISNDEVKGPFLPLRRALVMTADPAKPPPLTHMLARAGQDAVQLKTFLLVLWMGAYRRPHVVRYDPDVYAKALDLPDVTPGGKGARRVRDAIRKLEGLRLLSSERQGTAGPRTHIRLLKEDGSGVPYTNPAGMQYASPPEPGEGNYIQVPHDLMRNGWLSVLSGAALTTWLVLREKANYEEPFGTPMFISPTQREQRYGISQDTYLKGLGELETHGLVKRFDRKTKVGPGVFDWSRQQNVQLVQAVLETRP